MLARFQHEKRHLGQQSKRQESSSANSSRQVGRRTPSGSKPRRPKLPLGRPHSRLTCMSFCRPPTANTEDPREAEEP